MKKSNYSMAILHNWAIGVGSVIGGDFFGWSTVLTGGIGCAFVSVGTTMLLYFTLARSVGNLAKIVSKEGGAECFVEDGLGSFFGLLTAALELVKLIFVGCVGSLGIVCYLSFYSQLRGTMQYFLFVFEFFIFVTLNMFGATVSGSIQTVLTFTCLIILIFYWSSMMCKFNFALNALGDSGNGSIWFCGGLEQFVLAFPFASWLFLGFEELPVVIKADSSRSSQSNQTESNLADKSVWLSFMTVACTAVMTVLVGASSPPGSRVLSSAPSPLISGMKVIYGDNSWVVKLMDCMVVLALGTASNAFVLYSAHQLQNLARNGLLPAFFINANAVSCTRYYTKPSYQQVQGGSSSNDGFESEQKETTDSSPVSSLLTIAVISVSVLSALTATFGSDASADILIPACLLPAMTSYILQLQSLKILLCRSAQRSSNNNNEVEVTEKDHIRILLDNVSAGDEPMGASSCRRCETNNPAVSSAAGSPQRWSQVSCHEITLAQCLAGLVAVCILYSARIQWGRLTGVLMALCSTGAVVALMSWSRAKTQSPYSSSGNLG